MQRKWEVRRGGEWAPEATAPLLPFGFEAQPLSLTLVQLSFKNTNPRLLVNDTINMEVNSDIHHLMV